jgi:hypothetical protein
MAAKKEEGDPHMAHVAFKIPDFCPQGQGQLSFIA